MEAVQLAFEDGDWNPRDIHHACESLLQSEQVLPKCHRARLMEYRDCTALPESSVETLVDGIGHAEASMREFVERRHEEMPLMICTTPTSPSWQGRRIRWSKDVRGGNDGYKPRPPWPRPNPEAQEDSRPSTPTPTSTPPSRSKARKAQEAMSDGWKKFSSDVQDFFQTLKSPSLRRTGPIGDKVVLIPGTPPPPSYSQSSSQPLTRDFAYPAGSAPLSEGRSDQPGGRESNDGDSMETQPSQSRWSPDSSSGDDATRIDSATSNAGNRASVASGLKKWWEAIRRSST